MYRSSTGSHAPSPQCCWFGSQVRPGGHSGAQRGQQSGSLQPASDTASISTVSEPPVSSGLSKQCPTCSSLTKTSAPPPVVALCASWSANGSDIALAVNVVMYALFRRMAVARKPKNWGIVYDEKSKKPLQNVVARIFDAKYNKLLETQVTDVRGRYAFLVGQNTYYVTFEKLALPAWSAVFVTYLVIVGFPLAIVLAWFLEITPKGVVIDVDPGSRPMRGSFSKSSKAILGGLAIASLGLFIYDRYVGLPELADTARTAAEASIVVDPNSIAVLPFLNLSPNPEDE